MQTSLVYRGGTIASILSVSSAQIKELHFGFFFFRQTLLKKSTVWCEVDNRTSTVPSAKSFCFQFRSLQACTVSKHLIWWCDTCDGSPFAANGGWALNAQPDTNMAVSCDQRLGWLDGVFRPCFPATLLTWAKKWICGGSRRKRLSGMRRGVSLPRSIGESNPVLMFHSSLRLFYVFTFYFKCLFIWHRQRALESADKQRLGSIFICTWSQGDESGGKKKTCNLMQNQSSTLVLTDGNVA